MKDDLTRILNSAESGGKPGAGNLLPLVYDELRSLAAKKLAHDRAGETLQATALVHEAWLKLAGTDEQEWNDPAHFFRTAALAMRRILVDRAREKAAKKRGETPQVVNLDEDSVAAGTQDERILVINEALERLEEEEPESARVVTLKFFGGLTTKEIATMDGVSERAVERQWTYAKARLFHLIQHDV